MKTAQALFVFAALFITICSAAPSNSGAIHSSRLRVNCKALIVALPVPILHLHLSAASVTLELGYRPACHRTAAAVQPVTLTLKVTRFGRAELLLRSHYLRLAFPCRSA
jgi:hypothetical protein